MVSVGLLPGITDSLAQQFPNLSEGAIRAIAGGTAGALGSAVTGSDFGEGIVRGAIGQLAMPAVQDMTKRASEAFIWWCASLQLHQQAWVVVQ